MVWYVYKIDDGIDCEIVYRSHSTHYEYVDACGTIMRAEIRRMVVCAWFVESFFFQANSSAQCAVFKLGDDHVFRPNSAQMQGNAVLK